ncbi:phage tail fiber protein [Halomonas sp. GT]|uniref:phage tail fiber protein n=1 Tax=Halomonas sp. GT TaxID=1971364 RepID=UPI0009F416E1|nr:hypothetical protein [Halomonas sp. GT]
MATPTNYDQTNEWLAEVGRLAQDLANVLKGGINVGQSGTLGNLALIDDLSSAPIGNLSALQTALQIVNVAGRETTGSGRLLTEGKYGIGPTYENYTSSELLPNGTNYPGGGIYTYGNGVTVSDRPTGVSTQGVVAVFGTAYRNYRLVFPDSGNVHYARIRDGNVSGWRYFLDSANTTVDSNGFIKSASPIFRLANTSAVALNEEQGFMSAGSGAANVEAEGVMATHDDVGVYTINGSLGFATEGWTIEIPQDANGNRLCFIETEQAEDGTITVRTFSRRFDFDAVAVVAGDPMDIPDDRWIDLRLSMPEPGQAEPTDAA